MSYAAKKWCEYKASVSKSKPVIDRKLLLNRIRIVLNDNYTPVYWKDNYYDYEPVYDGIAKEFVLDVKWNCIKLSNLYAFAEEYNVSIDWLLGRTDKDWL